jgi:hypothetical protein
MRKTLCRFTALCALALAGNACAIAQTLTLLSADYGVEGKRIDVTCRVQSMVQNGSLGFRITNYELGGDPAPEQPKEFRIRARDYRGRILDYNFLERQNVNLSLTDRGPNCPNTGTNGPYQGRLNDDDQQRFDSYYTRWLRYRQENNQGEILSMQNRMYDVYNHYGIQHTVPFEQVVSPNALQESGGGYSDLLILQASYGVPGHTVDVADRLRSSIRNGSLTFNVSNENLTVRDPAPEKHKVLTLIYSYRGQQRTITAREHDDVTIP